MENRWRDQNYDLSLLDSMLDLLTRFNICITHPRDAKKIVVPSLLSETKPKKLSVMWTKMSYQKKIIGRSFQFPFHLFGLFDCLFVKFCQVGRHNVEFWKNGLLVVLENSYLLLDSTEETDKLGWTI